MLNEKTEWNVYLENMHQHAYTEFRGSNHYHELRINLDRMEESCKGNFREADFARIVDWVDVILNTSGAESEFMYRRGYRDCVGLLKHLQII